MYTCAQAQLDVQGSTLMLEQVDETEPKTFKLCSGPGCQYAAAAAGRTVVDVPQGGDTCRTPVRDANQPSARSKLQDSMTIEQNNACCVQYSTLDAHERLCHVRPAVLLNCLLAWTGVHLSSPLLGSRHVSAQQSDSEDHTK